MTEKTCFKCNKTLSLDNFYKNSRMSGGHFGKCKECTKSDVRANRKLKIEYYRQYDRDRANRIDRVLAREKYSKTEQGLKAANEAKKRWSENNAIKRGASHLVNNAVRDGRLVKKSSCESCGKSGTRIEGHHCDYSKPLEVIWLCSKCHREWHKNNVAIL